MSVLDLLMSTQGAGSAERTYDAIVVGSGISGGWAAKELTEKASSPLMAEEVAAQAALSVRHQVPLEMTIEATTETVMFREPRGEWR